MTGERGTRNVAVSAYAGLHKKKGLAAGELRVRLAAEKALGRRERRATILAERRGCSPLAERNTNAVAPAHAKGKAAAEQISQRRERLNRYKQEKEQRKRQELSKKGTLRPVFVVKHVTASPTRYLLSLPPGVTIAPPPAAAVSKTTMVNGSVAGAAVSRITTRSMARQQQQQHLGRAGALHKSASRTAAAQPKRAVPRVAPPAQEARPVVKGHVVAGAGVTGRVTRLRAKEDMAAAAVVVAAAPAPLAARRGARTAVKVDEVLHEERSVDGIELEEGQGGSRTPEEAPAKRRLSARRSFAPVGFVFQGLPGVVPMSRLQPLTPRSTSSFLAPAAAAVPLSFSPVRHGPPTELPAAPAAVLVVNVAEDTCVEMPAEGQERAPGAGIVMDPGSGETVAPIPVAGAVEAVGPAAHGAELHGVPYYRSLLREESARLTLQCEKWEGVNLAEEIPEEMSGRLRTTVGMARLLMAERFRQFEGLVDDCDLDRGDKPTTLGDLAGFWDMVFFQVKDVNQKFVNLEKLQDAGWKEELAVESPKAFRARKKAAQVVAVAPFDSAPPNDGALRAAARKRLAACRAVALARGAGDHCVQGEAPPPQKRQALPPQKGEASPPQKGETPSPQQADASPLLSPTRLRACTRSCGGSVTPSVTVAFKEETPRESRRRTLRKTPRPAPVPPSPDSPDSPLRFCQVKPSPAESLNSERDVNELERSISKYLVLSRAGEAHTPKHGCGEVGEESGDDEEEKDAGAAGEFLVPLPSQPGLLPMWRAEGSQLTTPGLGSASPLTTASPVHLLTPPVRAEGASFSNLIVFTPDATDDELPCNETLGSVVKLASVASVKKIRAASGMVSPLLSPVRRSLRLEGHGTPC